MYFVSGVSEDDIRCVGYYSDLKDAFDAVVNNYGDMNEVGCYPHAVIENIREGLYQYDTDPIWFEFDEKTEKYKRINNRPSYIGKHFAGFAIG